MRGLGPWESALRPIVVKWVYHERMGRILVTGATDGLGKLTAKTLLNHGHDVIIHARNQARLPSVRDLIEHGAEPVVADFSKPDEIHRLLDKLERRAPIDVVIHNAGVLTGPTLLPVNAVAPYLVTARMSGAARHIYLSSGYHLRGSVDLSGVDWSGTRATRNYDDSKLFVTALMAATARLRPSVLAHAVDPGWMPTKLGGAAATGELALGVATQVWIAETRDSAVFNSGQYWRYQTPRSVHPAVRDARFQDELLDSLRAFTGVSLC